MFLHPYHKTSVVLLKWPKHLPPSSLNKAGPACFALSSSHSACHVLILAEGVSQTSPALAVPSLAFSGAALGRR